MRICCIRHVGFEGPGIIGDWAEKNGHQLNMVRIWKGEPLPAVPEIEALIIMGGPMSAYDESIYPWLAAEKKLTANAVSLDVPVLGICLGAQVLASALGADVYPNAHKEIGWFPVEKTIAGKNSCLLNGLPQTFTTFHWHGDTFDLPERAEHLIRSEACENQAFKYRNALGLQFHMEMREEDIRELSHRCAHELVDAPYISAERSMLDHPAMNENHQALEDILEKWLELAL